MTPPTSPAWAWLTCQVATSAGMTRLNICTSSASSAHPPKQVQNVRRSTAVIWLYHLNMNRFLSRYDLLNVYSSISSRSLAALSSIRSEFCKAQRIRPGSGRSPPLRANGATRLACCRSRTPGARSGRSAPLRDAKQARVPPVGRIDHQHLFRARDDLAAQPFIGRVKQRADLGFTRVQAAGRSEREAARSPPAGTAHPQTGEAVTDGWPWHFSAVSMPRSHGRGWGADFPRSRIRLSGICCSPDRPW